MQIGIGERDGRRCVATVLGSGCVSEADSGSSWRLQLVVNQWTAEMLRFSVRVRPQPPDGEVTWTVCRLAIGWLFISYPAGATGVVVLLLDKEKGKALGSFTMPSFVSFHGFHCAMLVKLITCSWYIFGRLPTRLQNGAPSPVCFVRTTFGDVAPRSRSRNAHPK
jgi:hypothetical protein